MIDCEKLQMTKTVQTWARFPRRQIKLNFEIKIKNMLQQILVIFFQVFGLRMCCHVF